MNALKILGLLCSLAFLTQSAPTPEKLEDLELKRNIQRARSLVNKILRLIPVVHGSCVSTNDLTIDPPSQPTDMQHQSLGTYSGIPTAPELETVCRPVNRIDFPLDECLNSISAGLQLYQDVLGVLVLKVTSACQVTLLQADIRDLLAQINKMNESGLTSSGDQFDALVFAEGLRGDYEVQVATHVTLLRLRNFTHDLKRSLRNVEHLSSKKS
ncbi:hypothetical protein UPYG_G00052640 [Umbra pygmaea]|uniref:Interleukin-12 subunit alpha n=1 Tax=Umbra pygmaea TaxID=75934 RepID=A0ABD0XPJ2_UMBPY